MNRSKFDPNIQILEISQKIPSSSLRKILTCALRLGTGTSTGHCVSSQYPGSEVLGAQHGSCPNLPPLPVQVGWFSPSSALELLWHKTCL